MTSPSGSLPAHLKPRWRTDEALRQAVAGVLAGDWPFDVLVPD